MRVEKKKTINSRIKELEEEISILKDIQHNSGMKGAAMEINRKLLEKATPAELKFKHIAELKHLNLKFQYRIDIIYKNSRRILRFYFADFCDVKNKMIFEIDGEYHLTEAQQKKDLKRTRDLVKMGYSVYRITNQEVMEGKTTSFLYKAYLSKGIKI